MSEPRVGMAQRIPVRSKHSQTNPRPKEYWWQHSKPKLHFSFFLHSKMRVKDCPQPHSSLSLQNVHVGGEAQKWSFLIPISPYYYDTPTIHLWPSSHEARLWPAEWHRVSLGSRYRGWGGGGGGIILGFLFYLYLLNRGGWWWWTGKLKVTSVLGFFYLDVSSCCRFPLLYPMGRWW